MSSDALREDLVRRSEEVTEAVNRACSEIGDLKDPLLRWLAAPRPSEFRGIQLKTDY
jgi:hypothetical protein